MAVGKEILTKIRSVQNTQKITRAMDGMENKEELASFKALPV